MRFLCPLCAAAIGAAIVNLAPVALGDPPVPFASHNNLLVMRCTYALVNGSSAQKILIDEYDVSVDPPVLVRTIEMPFTGVDAIVAAGRTDHDRHIHRSMDGRFATFIGYHKEYGTTDPMADTAAVTPRMVCVMKYDGTYDLTTRLTGNYIRTAMRGAVTSDGTKIWIGGDNASGASSSGGTRFTTIGGSTSVNLSQVQSVGEPQDPDNIRDINIFAGQLYNCSGSNSSVGKGLFQVGVGLPTSGSQTLTRLNVGWDMSTTCLYILDANPGVPGVDTIYAASSATLGLHKMNRVNGSWVEMGTITSAVDAEQVTARLDEKGNAIIYVALDIGGSKTIYQIVDPQPYGGSISGSFAELTPFLLPQDGYLFGGVEWAPRRPFDFNADGVVDVATDVVGVTPDFEVFEACATGPAVPYDWHNLPAGCNVNHDAAGIIAPDIDRDGDVDQVDFAAFQRCLVGSDKLNTPDCVR